MVDRAGSCHRHAGLSDLHNLDALDRRPSGVVHPPGHRGAVVIL